jgi:urea transport system ATP-binding protein
VSLQAHWARSPCCWAATAWARPRCSSPDGSGAHPHGSITFDGKAIQGATPFERARAGIGFVPQGREIFARLTVEENLRMGLAYKSASTPIDPELYELFPVLKQMLQPARRRPVGRAAAAAGDRPRAGRAPQAADPGRADRGHPAQHHQGHRPRDPHAGRPRHMAILLVEQYYDFAQELADDYLVMERGEFIARGKGETMQADGVRQLVSI